MEDMIERELFQHDGDLSLSVLSIDDLDTLRRLLSGEPAALGTTSIGQRWLSCIQLSHLIVERGLPCTYMTCVYRM